MEQSLSRYAPAPFAQRSQNCANDFFNALGTQICNYELGTISYNYIISFLNALQLKIAEIKAPLCKGSWRVATEGLFLGNYSKLEYFRIFDSYSFHSTTF